MKDFREYLFPILLLVLLYAVFLIFPINFIFGWILLAAVLYLGIDVVFLYLNYIWWPYQNWISLNTVDIEDIEIETAKAGEKIKAVVIRPLNMDKSKKHIGVLFHHGYTGKKEKVYRFAIPLAMNGCVVVCPDARGHGANKKNKKLKMDDFKGIMDDITKEIDHLAALPEVDSNKLCMMGHSMGGIMTLSAGYMDDRIKKLVAISAPYDMITMFQKHRTVVTRFIYKRITKFLKKDPEFIESGETLEDWNKKISAKYIFEYESPLPDNDRVYLVHCKEDDLILFNESEQAKKHLHLPDENVLFMDMPKWKYLMAAHNLTGQATLIATFCVQVAKSLE
ncbi:MAG: alpha/beta hydrolase family protein [Promethearchaeota archaeon]